MIAPVLTLKNPNSLIMCIYQVGRLPSLADQPSSSRVSTFFQDLTKGATFLKDLFQAQPEFFIPSCQLDVVLSRVHTFLLPEFCASGKCVTFIV